MFLRFTLLCVLCRRGHGSLTVSGLGGTRSAGEAIPGYVEKIDLTMTDHALEPSFDVGKVWLGEHEEVHEVKQGTVHLPSCLRKRSSKLDTLIPKHSYSHTPRCELRALMYMVCAWV